ncbi:MAG: cellulose binding domain-containing protein [Planctomycetes bacterium]|nr:cellulose binding domain-containing protein [Planctomycetota bacterium]
MQTNRLAVSAFALLLLARTALAATTFTFTDQWTTGGQGAFSVTNSTALSTSSWTLQFDWNANITSLWNGSIQSHVGNHYTVVNAGWNGVLAPGASAEIGCIYTTSTPGVAPTNVVFSADGGSGGGGGNNPNCPADLDGSGEVDGGDIGLVLLDFGPCPGCRADLDASGEVDGGDAGLVLLSFGPCTPVIDPADYTKMPTVEQRKIVGYYPNWGIYQKNFPVTQIRADRINVVNYAFLIPLDRTMPAAWNRTVSWYRGWTYTDYANFLQQPAGPALSAGVGLFDEWADTGANSGAEALTMSPAYREGSNFAQLRDLKNSHSKLRTMISIGGWTLSAPFFSIVRDAQKRADFAKSAVYVMARYGFDGIDIDWEYPGGGGFDGDVPADRATDGANYLLLLQALRSRMNQQSALDGHTYYLSIAAPAGDAHIADIDPAAIASIVDWINVMSYDFHGGWDSYTGLNSPMVNVDPTPYAAMWSVSGAIGNYRNGLNGHAGVPASKIVVGMPFYGRGWNNVNPGPNGDGLGQSGTEATSPALGETEFPYNTLFSSGVLTYSNGVFTGAGGYTRHWNAQAKVPYLYSAAKKQFITYDDPESMRAKVDFANQESLGGVMFWELSEDATQPGTSLLDAIYDRMHLP